MVHIDLTIWIYRTLTTRLSLYVFICTGLTMVIRRVEQRYCGGSRCLDSTRSHQPGAWDDLSGLVSFFLEESAWTDPTVRRTSPKYLRLQSDSQHYSTNLHLVVDQWLGLNLQGNQRWWMILAQRKVKIWNTHLIIDQWSGVNPQGNRRFRRNAETNLLKKFA